LTLVKQRQYYALPFLAIIAMAAEAVIVELFYVVFSIPTLTVAAIAVPSAGLILLLFKRHGIITLFKQEYKSILLISLLFAITEFMWYDSLARIGAGKVSLIELAETILIIAMAWVFLSEKLTGRKMLGGSIVLIGIIISVSLETTKSEIGGSGIGEIEAIIAALSGAVYVILVTRLLHKHDEVHVTGFSLLLSGLMLQIQWLFLTQQNQQQSTEIEWTWLLVLTPILPLAVFLFQFMSYARIGAALTSIIVSTHVFLVIIIQVILYYYSDIPVALPENLALASIGGTISIGGIVILERE
jgi:drug/metabolite transporter (DMT)-like permease